MGTKSVIKANGICSPKAQKYYEKYGTCIPPNYLRHIAQLYNMSARKEDRISKHILSNTRKLWNALISKLDCDTNESNACVVRHPMVQSQYALYKKLAETLRPQSPSSWKANPREWLSDDDIRKVMKQYEDVYPTFSLMGVFPIDFKADGVCKLFNTCEFNLFDFLASGKKNLGIILNLDTHDGRGTHWVSVFCCFDHTSKKFGMCYYDSGAVDPPPHAVKFLSELKADAALFFKDIVPNFDRMFKKKCNIKKHQSKNTECGIFSMLFVIACLEHKSASYHHICGMMGERWDDEAQKYRKKLYYDTYA